MQSAPLVNEGSSDGSSVVRFSLLILLAAFSVIILGCGTDDGGGESPAATSEKSRASENEGHAEGGEVHFTEQQLEALGITVKALESGSVSSALNRPATVVFDMDRVVKVGPRISSKVVRVLKDLGQPVRAGEALAIMSSVELGKAKAEYMTARARLETAEAAFQREQSLYDQEISSEAEMLEARARFREARAEAEADREALRLYGLSTEQINQIQAGDDQPLSYFVLTSPAPGWIQERDISPGQTVGPDETPIQVADPSQLWVLIDAFERDVPLLAVDQQVELSFRSLPGQIFEARTDWVSFALDSRTRTISVRAVVDNPEGLLRAGMFGTAHLHTVSDVEYALIPVDAVQVIDGNDVVFVPGDEPGSFAPASVYLGDESDGYVEIISGLQPGAIAVVAGAFDVMSALTASSRSADHGH